MKLFNYEYDKVQGVHHPASYPSDQKPEQWSLPDDIKTDFSKLNAIIETKYTREYLKICAFYNKIFPSLRTASWTRSSYNVAPFTAMDQEHSDTGTGISCNYLKQIIDQVVSRIGTVSFDPMLLADVPTLEYIIYKEEVERLIRKSIRNEQLNRMTLEVFHDAAVLGYSHILIDPVTHKFIKANDYEIGMYEAQYNRSDIKQLLYRDYGFPVTSLVPYLVNTDKVTKEKLIDEIGHQTTVDFKMYFDCPAQKVYLTVNGTTLEPWSYPFEAVQMVTFAWDVGFSKVTSTSLFDLLYPVQRELNKLNAKMQQLIRMYKGAVPIINGADDLVWKNISNGSGEALYLNGARPASDIITIINPTPLDPALSAEMTSRKTEMYELAGIQQVSFDMENMRSAAAVIALDQTRDTVFQAQLEGIGSFVKALFKTYVHYNAVCQVEDSNAVSWEAVEKLIDDAVIELKPVHVNDPLGNVGVEQSTPPPDYQQIQLARAVIAIIQGRMSFDSIPFTVDPEQLKLLCAATIVKLAALGIDTPESIVVFMLDAYIDDVQQGRAQLSGVPKI